MDFSKVKLKQTKVVEKKVDYADMAKQLEIQKQQLNYLSEKVREADLEQWYDALKNFTYETQFVEITLEEGKAMHDLYEARMTGKNLEKEELIIEKVIQKLQATMDKFPDGSFVKLSSRSAKDASVASKRTIAIFKELLEKIENPTMNQKLIAINRAHILALQLTSAKEVMDMFLGSERINSDLDLALQFSSTWSQHFIVRKFVPIPIEFEFRAFVVNNQLRGMCQYYHYIYFPTLVENKEKISNLILQKFEEMKETVPIRDKTYVVDWAVDFANEKVYVIELNPFGDYENMGTSSAMFKLHDNIVAMDRKGPDREIFFGDKPFEFRIETAEKDDVNLWNLMFGPWKSLFYEMFGDPLKKT
jgi:hypothetical protein